MSGLPGEAEWATYGDVIGNTIIYQRSDGTVVRTSHCEVHSWFDCNCERTRTRSTVSVGIMCDVEREDWGPVAMCAVDAADALTNALVKR